MRLRSTHCTGTREQRDSSRDGGLHPNRMGPGGGCTSRRQPAPSERRSRQCRLACVLCRLPCGDRPLRVGRPKALPSLQALGKREQVVVVEPWFSNRTKSIVKSPKLYLADTGLLCALLNIRSKDMLRQSPAAGAVWETFVLAQLRRRESRAGRRREMDRASIARRRRESGLCPQRRGERPGRRRGNRLSCGERLPAVAPRPGAAGDGSRVADRSTGTVLRSCDRRSGERRRNAALLMAQCAQEL